MFARNVSINLKSNMLSDYTRTFEKDVLPLLRKQKGFTDEITLSNPNSPDAIAISLWENRADAEAYNTNTYPEVLKTLARMIDGTPKVRTFETITSTLHKVAVAPRSLLTMSYGRAVNSVFPSDKRLRWTGRFFPCRS